MSVSTGDLEMLSRKIIDVQPLVGLAVGMVHDGRLEWFVGHGVADRDTGEPIDEDTVFRIASITKTFTAVAIMQLHERGLIDIDGEAGEYLRAFRLTPTDPSFRPPTVRNLLTHTAGLPELAHLWGVVRPDFGESFPAGRGMPSLAQFYRGSLRVQAEPGTRFVYNNHGPATLGQIVADVTGSPLDRFFRDNIFEPLGMTGSSLLRDDVAAKLATGYEIGRHGAEEIDERDMVTAGAASVYSTPRDMARYMAALLGGGKNEHGSILRPETLRTMYEPQWQPDPRVPGMGLGFFRASHGGHCVARHQGTHPGFHSEMALAPQDGIGVMAFTNGSSNADFWLPPAVGRLLRSALGVTETPPALGPIDAGTRDEICGWYRLDAGATDIRLRGMMGFGAEVFPRGDRVMFRFLSPIPALVRGFPLEPDDAEDPYAFRMDLGVEGMDPTKLFFGRQPDGGLRLYLDLMPLVLDKQRESTNPRRWATGVAGALGVSLAAAALSGSGGEVSEVTGDS